MTRNETTPVIAGLAVGIGFVVLFSALSELPRLSMEVLYPPEVGKNAEKAIRIALENDELQQMFDGKDIVVASVRDFGVTSMDCPINSCAVIVFAEKPGINTRSVAALVNILSEKVVDISPSTSWRDAEIIEKTQTLTEVKYFLSKYPDAEMIINRYPDDHTEIIYRIERPVFVPEEIKHWPDTHTLSLWIELTASTGKIKDVYVECGAGGITDRVTANIIDYAESTDCLNPNWDNVDYGQHD